MSKSTPHLEAALAATLRSDTSPPPDLAPVLRRARRRVAIHRVLLHLLGRIWLALARLFAPVAARWHRLSHPSTHRS